MPPLVSGAEQSSRHTSQTPSIVEEADGEATSPATLRPAPAARQSTAAGSRQYGLFW